MRTLITDFLKHYDLEDFNSYETEGGIQYRNFEFIFVPQYNHWTLKLRKQGSQLTGTFTPMEVARMIVMDHITRKLRRHFDASS